MIRFAHEINGNWYAWKMRPALYREKFHLLAHAIHSTATNTAMVWAPNQAGSYPYGVYNGMTRTTYTNGYGTLADWVLLDGNGDWVLQNPGELRDDPYAPFLPGEQYVDWIGMTLYHWGQVYPWWYNCMPFAVRMSTNGPYEGAGCLRVDYIAPASPYGVTVAVDFSALGDPWTTWSNNNAIYLRVKVQPGPA